MILRDSLEWFFWFGLLGFVFWLAIGCGQVSPRAGAVEGGEGGRAGIGLELDAGQAGAPELERDAAADAAAAAAADAAADAPAPPVCLPASSPGFALGGTCDGGAPASKGCHAACTLEGAPFVGCVSGTPYAAACYASCGACGGM